MARADRPVDRRDAAGRGAGAAADDGLRRLRPDGASLHAGNLVPLLHAAALAAGRPPADRHRRRRDRPDRRPERTVVRARHAYHGRGREPTSSASPSSCSRFLDFAPGPAQALLVNNLDWTAPLSAIDFLRDVGKHFPVNAMLDKDSVRTRLDGGGLTFAEFSYQLLQAIDYLELLRRYDCRLQIGGSDQWGNITAGLDFIRRVTGEAAHGADGAAGDATRAARSSGSRPAAAGSGSIPS